MGKTLADLKRDCKNGAIEVELQAAGMWANGLPERLKGWRRAIGANTVAVFFQNADWRKSELSLSCASLVEYTENAITVYKPGARDFTDEEKRILEEWKKIEETPEYKKQAEMDIYTDGSSTFYKQKYFFKDRGAEYLLGYDWQAGKKYDYNTGRVLDKKIKGEPELVYNVRRVEGART